MKGEVQTDQIAGNGFVANTGYLPIEIAEDDREESKTPSSCSSSLQFGCTEKMAQPEQNCLQSDMKQGMYQLFAQGVKMVEDAARQLPVGNLLGEQWQKFMRNQCTILDVPFQQMMGLHLRRIPSQMVADEKALLEEGFLQIMEQIREVVQINRFVSSMGLDHRQLEDDNKGGKSESAPGNVEETSWDVSKTYPEEEKRKACSFERQSGDCHPC